MEIDYNKNINILVDTQKLFLSLEFSLTRNK